MAAARKSTSKAKQRAKTARKSAKPTKALKAARSASKAARKPAARKAAAKPTPRKRPDKFTLYGLYLSLPSTKVGLMLSMCGARYDYKHVNLMAGEHKTPDFVAKNRYAQVPVLAHDGKHICQSNVILGYLADHLGKFGGRTPDERLRIAEWLAWDLDRMASGLGLTRGFTRFFPQDPAVLAMTRSRGEQALDFLDRHLGGTKFIVGSAPTIADIAIYPSVATADEGGFDISRWSNVRAWAERMLALPGSGHPYSVMAKEDRPAA